MDLYYASTPYNILVNLLIKKSRNEDADLIISDFSAQNYDIYKKISMLKIFNHVYFVKQKQFEQVEFHDGLIRRVFRKIGERANNRLFFEKLFKRECSDMISKQKYDIAFFDATNYLQRVIFYHYKKINKKLMFYKTDCGIESYYNNTNTTIRFKWIRDVTRKMMKSYLGTYLIDKRLCLFDNKPTFQIDLNNLNINEINNIFDYKGDDGIFNNEVVYFDQKLDYQEWTDIQTSICDALAEKSKSFVVKLHPRTEAFIYKDKPIIKSKSTFELMLLNNKDKDFSKKIYVTPMSTAAFLPKMLLDKEPYVIFVMDIMGLHFPEEDAVRKFVDKAKTVYSSNKVYSLSTREELEETLNKIGTR